MHSSKEEAGYQATDTQPLHYEGFNELRPNSFYLKKNMKRAAKPTSIKDKENPIQATMVKLIL
jgi:hypothetical protein